MEDLLEIECCSDPEDKLTLRDCSGTHCIVLIDQVEDENGHEHQGCVMLTAETAEQLRDALTEWLEVQ